MTTPRTHCRPVVPPPPTGLVSCGCCGCLVSPRIACHCGAVMSYAYDHADGWYLTGSWPSYRIIERGTPPTNPDLVIQICKEGLGE